MHPGWSYGLPSPIYPKKAVVRDMSECSESDDEPDDDSEHAGSMRGSEDWDLHAPKVAPVGDVFQHDAGRWLTKNSFTDKIAELARRNVQKAPVKSSSNCKLSNTQLKKLVEAGIVKPYIHEGESILFLGDIFLHPEPAKRRWRIIFHPALFNWMVRLLRLHSVSLPSQWSILSIIHERRYTLKIDLKCAFFQIPIEEGLFGFKKGSRYYTLTRLPMGSSVSVIVAQALSTRVAEGLVHYLSHVSTNSAFACFVDDIFVSFDSSASQGDLVKAVYTAMRSVAIDMNVTFKMAQLYGNATATLWKTGEVNLSKLDEPQSHSPIPPIECIRNVIEVLGALFEPATKNITIKPENQMSFRMQLKKVKSDITPQSLWKKLGICFYVAYVLGISLASFRSALLTISSVARMLGGANKNNQIWRKRLCLTAAQVNGLNVFIDRIREFPRGIFQPVKVPGRIIFTDSSYNGWGAVSCVNGRVRVIAGEWSGSLANASINTKETVVALIGLSRFENSRKIPLLVVDSTVALCNIARGHSREKFANEACRLIRTTWELCIAWVPTEIMPADGPSRGEQTDILAKVQECELYGMSCYSLPKKQ